MPEALDPHRFVTYLRAQVRHAEDLVREPDIDDYRTWVAKVGHVIGERGGGLLAEWTARRADPILSSADVDRLAVPAEARLKPAGEPSQPASGR